MKKTASLLAVALCLIGSRAHAETTFSGAVNDYNAHRYGPALTKLAKLEMTNPNNDKIHYYMALSYQGSSQMAAAQQEYSWVAENSSDARLRHNAVTALRSIGQWNLTRAYAGNGNVFQQSQSYVQRARLNFSNSSSGKT